jgi:hypothetical protein
MAQSLGPGVMRQSRSSIALVGAAVIAALVGLAAVSVDLGNFYVARVSDQRAADSAAYAGALAYNASGSTATMQAAAGNLAVLNGYSAAATTATLVPSPSGDGNNAVDVTISAKVPMYLAEVFQSETSHTVTATSYAEVRASAKACIIALQAGGSGVTLSGGTSVTANNCTIASDNTVTVPCGTTITTKTLNYNSAAVPSAPCGGIKPPSGTASVTMTKKPTADPLASNTTVAGAFTHLAAVGSLTGPSGPTVSAGTSINFAYSKSLPQSQLATIGCSGSFASPIWTVTCAAGGPYYFGGITLGGGITLNFATSGPATNNYIFSGAIEVSGTAANFGPGNYKVAGGIITDGGSTATFGAGTYQIGPGTNSCSGSSYSICNTGSSLTFGAGSFTIAAGVYNSGGEILSLGAGSSANSFNIGPGSTGYAINTGGGSTTTFGDMTTGTFQAVGKVSTGGGSTITLSAAPAHDINGTFSLAGSAILGAGTYTVAGNVALGTGGGGGSVTGAGVSVITSGSFSVAAGYSNVTLTAPISGTMQNIVVAGNTTGGASFSEGASGNSLSGLFYFPIGPVALSGGANVGNGSGQCLELIGSTITLTGGSTLATTCAGLGGSGGGTVVLVQ